METLHSKSKWPISEPVKVAEFGERWRDLFKDSINIWSESVNRQLDTASEDSRNIDISTCLLSSPECLVELIPENLLDGVINICEFDTLQCKEEHTNYIFANRQFVLDDSQLPYIPKKHDLTTLTMQESDLKQRFQDPNYAKYIRKSMKHKNTDQLLLPKLLVGGYANEIPPDEIILSVLVCNQSKRYAKYNVQRGGNKYFVLGSQKLTELKDVISCSADLQPIGDFSGNPESDSTEIAKNVYKSGFFFFNGVFYNDMRYPQCKDNSKVIHDWLLDNPETQIKFGRCSTQLMDEATFNELEIKLGNCYLYMHQGDCEHFIIFDDLRLISTSDSKNREDYPLCYSTKRERGLRCMVCYAFPPKWVTKNHKRVHADPFLFCDTCFYSFNYDAQKQKIGEFEAHPYVNL
ncbi:small nuclear RNA activating complex, polypeptide 3 [Chamberlinius hualienensis]